MIDTSFSYETDLDGGVCRCDDSFQVLVDAAVAVQVSPLALSHQRNGLNNKHVGMLSVPSRNFM